MLQKQDCCIFVSGLSFADKCLSKTDLCDTVKLIFVFNSLICLVFSEALGFCLLSTVAGDLFFG